MEERKRESEGEKYRWTVGDRGREEEGEWRREIDEEGWVKEEERNFHDSRYC